MAPERGSASLRVLVIGAGSAGLLIAHALKKVEIACTVFEADETATTRIRDWNFGIYWAQSPLASLLPPELLAELEQKAQVDDHVPSKNDILPIFNVETGELMNELPTPFALRLQRRKWLALLREGLDVRYGKRLSTIQTTGDVVTAQFTDGTTEEGNLLFGTEGAHSPTRELLLGRSDAALVQSPIVGSASITKLPREAALKARHHRYTIAFHPNGTFVWVGLHETVGLENPEDWEFMLLTSWLSPEDNGLPRKGPEIAEDMRARAKNWGEPFKEIYESIPVDANAWHGRLSLWPTREWDDLGGKVTLAGDAAHPMTYHRGQGLNNAVLDAADFVEKLEAMEEKTPEHLARAVQEYDRDLWPRAREAVLASEANSMMIHDWERLKDSPLMTYGVKRLAE